LIDFELDDFKILFNKNITNRYFKSAGFYLNYMFYNENEILFISSFKNEKVK